MKERKAKLLFVLLLFVGILLAACGNDEAAGDDTIEIQFMHTLVQQERLDVITGIIDRFEDAYPNIKVEQVVVEEDNLNTNIITLASSGQLPEIVEVGADYARVLDKDELIDNDAVARVISEIGENNYYEGALKLVRTEDGTSFRGVPLSGWVQGVWYNKEMLASEGFDTPENWADILEIAEAFTDVDSRQYGIGLPTVEGGFSEQAFSQFALSNNANILDADGNLTLNTPEMEEALTFYQELSNYTMPGSNATTEVRDAFMNGTVPMAMYSTYILPTIFNQGDPSNVGYAIPSNKAEAVFGTVTSLTITSALEDAQREAAETFLKFMAEVENTTDWVLMAPGGAQPVHRGVIENDTYKNHEVVQAFGDLFQQTAASFDDIRVFGLVDNKNFVKMGEITSSGVLPAMVNSVTVGGNDVKAELEKAEQALQSIAE